MKFSSYLRILLIGVSIVFSFPQKTAALSQQEISQISQSITVKIDPQGCTNKNGSGIVIKREGNTYTILTAYHVIKNNKCQYKIIAPDGKHYLLNYKTVKRSKENNYLDLAVFQLISNSNYPVAKIGDSNQVIRQTNTYVGGFPVNSQTQNSANFKFLFGVVGGRPSSAIANRYYIEGYTLIYTNTTLEGMSGGSVLNEQGELIGVHGKGGQAIESGKRFRVKKVITQDYYLGIPINTAFSFFREIGIDVKVYPPSARIANTSKADDLLWQSINQNQKGDKKSAIAYLDEAIKIDPSFAELYNNRGLLHSDLEDKQSALIDFTEAIKVNPQFVDAYLNRASIYYELGDVQKALIDCNLVIKINPNNADAHSSRGVFNTKLGNIKDASADFERALELYSKLDNKIIYEKLAVVYFNRGTLRKNIGDIQGALSDYNKAIDNNNTYSEAYLNRGSIRDDMRDFQQAIKDYELAIQHHSKYPEAYLNWGATNYKLGDKQGAIDKYNEALKINPNYAEAYYNLGKVKYDLGDKQGTIKDYTQAIKLNPNISQAYYNRGIARKDTGDQKGAVADYTQAIKINPTYAEAYNNRGKLRFFSGDKSGGIADMKKAAELFKQQGKLDEYEKLIKVLEYL